MGKSLDDVPQDLGSRNKRLDGVMAITSDFESVDPSSILGPA